MNKLVKKNKNMLCMILLSLFVITSCERMSITDEEKSIDNVTIADNETDYPVILENEAPYNTLWHESYFSMVFGTIQVDVEDFESEGIWVFSPVDDSSCFKFGKVTPESGADIYDYYAGLVSDVAYGTSPNPNKIKTESIAELAEWIETKTQAGMQVTVRYNKRTHKYIAVAYNL